MRKSAPRALGPILRSARRVPFTSCLRSGFEEARSSIGFRIPLFQGGEEGSTPSRAIDGM